MLLCSLIASCRFKHIVLSDLVESNRLELYKWLNRHEDAIDWTIPAEHIAAFEGYNDVKKGASEIMKRTRSAIRKVVPCDVLEPGVLPEEHKETFDVVLSSGCLDAVAADHESFRMVVCNVGTLVKPGGLLVIMGAFGVKHYTVGADVLDDCVRKPEAVKILGKLPQPSSVQCNTCGRVANKPLAKFELRTASQATDFLWSTILASLPKKRPRLPPAQDVRALGNTQIPDKALSVLQLGPKYCNPIKLDKPELLSLVRRTAAKAEGEAVALLREANLKLLLSDKEGGLVVIPDKIYSQKSLEAITGNFRPLKDHRPKKVKAEAIRKCQQLGLTTLATSVRNSRGLSLECFFTAKTHKTECPFRVIVSERGTWQHSVGSFLQKSLSVLELDDPFLVRRPSAVSDYLEQLHDGNLQGFSVDVKDLYYSLPHDLLCEVVSDCIDRFGTIKFQNSCGVSVADFLDLLLFYLRSTSVVYCDQFYIQRKGVCIGSCLAPVLSDLLLAYYDRLLEISLRDFKVARVFRYVDDFLVLFQTSGADTHRQVENIFEIFKSNLRVFTLTKELTEDNQLRFLDLILVFGAEHLNLAGKLREGRVRRRRRGEYAGGEGEGIKEEEGSEGGERSMRREGGGAGGEEEMGRGEAVSLPALPSPVHDSPIPALLPSASDSMADPAQLSDPAVRQLLLSLLGGRKAAGYGRQW
ncbi:hypothetical protein ISCGN_013995 [Ixodes scapularis]